MKPDVDVAIVGAGFAGLGAAIRLQQRGKTSFVIFERASDVGGTWRDNVYPNCACDVPSHLYSFSFAPNPAWSRKYSPQPEILTYLQNVVEQFTLRPYIRFRTDIVRTEFSEQTGFWTLTDRAGNVTTARVVVGATGPLNRLSLPKLPGIETFTGPAFHTSNWNTSTDLTGKRVAVVGTGASAIQVVPAIAPKVAQLTVFQRTAPYVTPRQDRQTSAFEQRLFASIPLVRKAYRGAIFWLNELTGLSFLGNETLHKVGSSIARKHLETAISDPELRRKATPDYKMGCKRVLVSDDYYPALARPNVELVTDPIAEVRPNSLVTTDGTERPVDVLIYATGFTVASIVSDLSIRGRAGRKLFDEWLTTGPQAHYGITVSGFPNLLLLVGPNTGLGHNSIVHIIESQLNYMISYLDLLDRAGEGVFLDVRPDAQEAYNNTIQQRMIGTVWASGCRSWYMDAQGRNTTIWPALASTYRNATRRVNPADYERCHRPT
ncbi:flavin-containing monooxygenase [Spirosoma montaniterrae]|uniref:4-hydroxyacetophenone monooxygenase n=1 Tax=Spirosoma montaniterrae TaxID=1178516 RepID=A0A1P9WXX2_9BACT|nr:NAD(P)/FAD-dependent oxidoreductase [Spirosoma montaniterrae]AQG80168.1 4-hydroxyacetophenone monooxygenase [Spirosoma montaniterrae]